MAGLRIARGLALDVDVAGEAIAILAKRGAGKTNTGRVLVEELHGAGVQVVVLDPVGAWWGLRSSADGKSGGGLPLPILGGAHGDVPLQAAAGGLLADVVVDAGQSIVLDLSDFSKTEQRRFVTDFAERLYQRKARERTLLHLVLEEADEFAPQRVSAGDARMVGAIEQLVRRGRGRGIGLTMITQRSASLNKSILTQADVLFAMRTTGPQDRKAIESWVEKQDVDGADDVVPSLPSLATGEAWIWNPERGLLQRVQIRLATTYDSSSTAKAGQKGAGRLELAPIDLAKLGDQIEATAKRAKDNDPAELRKKIRGLEDQLRADEQTIANIYELEQAALKAGEPERVEVPVLQEAELGRLEHEAQTLLEWGVAITSDLTARVERLQEISTEILIQVRRVRAAGDEAPPLRPATPQPVPAPRRAEQHAPAAANAASGAASSAATDLPLAASKLLRVLGQFPEGRTQKQLGVLAGYKVGGSSYRGGMAELRKRGYASAAGVEPIVATPEGRAAASTEPLPTGRALYEHWLGELPKGARTVLAILYEAWPNGFTGTELAERAGYEPGGSSYRGAIAALRNVDLATPSGVEPIKASDELMETS